MNLPHKFGKYVLLEKVASGGMAEIYRAKFLGERGFEKDIAVKRILPHWSSNRSFEKMLIDEAKALVHLQHQNIVQVFELGRDGDYYYISMEYVDGIDLRLLYKKVEGGGLPEKYACYIVSEVLKALEFAHHRKGENDAPLNIVHRDISPQNIMISYNGEVKLTDFGIAKGLHREEETTHHQVKGKYAYMSPEQIDGAIIDHRSDLYSVAIVLFEMITGRRLFKGDSDFELMERVRKSEKSAGWEAMIGLNLRRIFAKALSPASENRYQSAAEFLGDLNEYISFKKLHTHGIDLATYVCGIFTEEKKRKKDADESIKRQPTKIITKLPVKNEKGLPSGLKAIRYAALVVLFIPLLAIAAYRPTGAGDRALISPHYPLSLPLIKGENLNSSNSRVQRGRTATPTDSPLNGSIVTPDVPLINENEVRQTIKATDKKADLTPPSISVQARPWGYVYIPGVIEKRESPVNSVRLKPGKYSVKVYYEPSNLWARAEIDAKEGKSYKCLADFTNGSSMRCK